MSQIEQALFLQNLPGVGAASYWRLVEQFGSAKDVLNAPINLLETTLSEEACAAIGQYQRLGERCPMFQQVQRDLDWAAVNDVLVLDTAHPLYPSQLKQIKRPPPLLWVQGQAEALSMPQIAIVGSRNPTAGGKDNALKFASDLAAHGFTITSGLALGIDAAAHQGALNAHGSTVAVVGTGIDVIYPARHSALAQSILQTGGAIVSEFPLGTKAQPGNFPQRNRVISGLSAGVLVVEAAVKSGSLITAKYAVQQDREVFAIPGSIHNPLSRGGHALIKDGAKLVETAKDIVVELKGFLSFKQSELELLHTDSTIAIRQNLVVSDHEEVILDNLGYDTVDLDTLAKRTDIPTGELLATLLTMELKGLVGNVGHGYVRTHKIEGKYQVSDSLG